MSIPPDDDLAATIVMWRRTPGGPFLSHSGALDQAAAACALTFERQRSDLLLRRSARTDGLTGVANRVDFFEQLAAATSRHLEETAVLYLDLDGFKQVNDSHGHMHGDRALCAVADVLADALDPGHLLARLGGDEFAVLCRGINRRADVEAAADRLVAAVRSLGDVDGVPLTLGLSIGVAFGADVDAREATRPPPTVWWVRPTAPSTGPRRRAAAGGSPTRPEPSPTAVAGAGQRSGRPRSRFGICRPPSTSTTLPVT